MRLFSPVITGSLNVTGSAAITGSINNLFIGLGNGNIPTNISIGSTIAFSGSNTGNYNTAIGQNSLCSNTTGTHNTAIGYAALRSNLNGSNNTAIGNNALYSSTVSNHNTAIGCNALRTNLVGNYNTAIGLRALCANFVGANNTAIGNDALRNNTNGSGNTAIGKYTLSSNTTGNYNTAIDRNALRYNTIGTGNAAIGYNALRYNTTGCHNIAHGLGAMRCNISGNYNVALGEQALRNITSGSCNVILGVSAARLNSVSGGITSLSSSVVIGANTKPSASGDINEIVIGDSAVGLGSNTTVIGNSNTTTARIWGQLTANSFTGSLFGTASNAVQALSASFASTASVALQVSTSISTQNLQHNVLFVDTSGPGIIQVDGGLRYNPNQNLLTTTSSYAIQALSASYLNTLNQDLIFNGNLTLNGTASISYLNVAYESASVIYSSGSNQFGDAANDTQTLWGTIDVKSGPVLVTGSIIANSFTGSLLGTSSYSSQALTASFASTASFVQQAISSSFATSASYALSSSFASTVPASGVIGLNLSQISTGSVTASVSLSQFSVTSGSSTELVVTGTGVTIGNALTDTHSITGSSSITGSLGVTGTTTLTGSFNISGSTTQVGSNTLLGNTILSGNITISGSSTPGSPTASVQIYGDIRQTGYHRFDPVTTNIDPSISASYIYVSGSTNDLYFSQNGDGYTGTTRLRWLEGNLYTGLLHGGLISTASSTTFNISSGSGIIVDLNASLDDDPFPVAQYVNWGNLNNQSLTYLTSSIQTFVGVSSAGTVIQQTDPWSSGQYNTSFSIGTVLHQNTASINGTISYPNVAYGWKQRSYDFIKAFGPLKLSGYTIFTSSSLGLTVGSGTAWADGRNYQTDPNNPSYITDPGTNVSKIFRYYVSGSTYNQDTNSGLGYTTIDPTKYNDNGVLTTITSSRPWSNQRVFYYPNSVTKGIVVYYGSAVYATQAEAEANLQYENFQETPNTQQNAIYLGVIVIKYNGTFATPSDYIILPGGIFRNVGGSGGGGAVSTTLAGLSDVSITGPTQGQGFAYDASLTKWVNTSSMNVSITGNASTATTASFANTASYAAQALTASFATTASYVQNAQTASYILQAVSASYALSSSFALTVPASGVIGLNLSQIATGSVTASVSLTQFTVTSGSSTEFVVTGTGVTIGNALTDAHAITGSLGVTGSINNLFIGRGNGNISSNISIGATTNFSSSTTGLGENIGIGSNSLQNNTSGFRNIAIGFKSLQYNTTGCYNTAIGGLYALQNNTTGKGNTAIGLSALCANTAGGYNTAIGKGTLRSNSTGCFNTAIGLYALRFNTTGNNNTAIGFCSLRSNSTGANNTAIGYCALRSNTIGASNTAIGFKSLQNNTTATYNTAIGYHALYNNSTGVSNTAIGFHSLFTNSAGDYNTAIGFNALRCNTTGCYNTAIGKLALCFNTTGNNNTAIGDRALCFNTTGYNNTAIGKFSLRCNTTGWSNVSIGICALKSNTTGVGNTAIGEGALSQNTTANSNLAIGPSTLFSNTTGCNNVAVGENALLSNTTGRYNTAIGVLAQQCNTTGRHNTAIGPRAQRSNTTGNNNTVIGYRALANNMYGSNNIALGYKTNCVISNSQNNIVIGTNIGVSQASANQINIGGIIFGSGSFADTGSATFSGSSNGFVGINQPNPQYSLDVSGSFRVLQSLYLNQNTSSLASGNRIISSNPTGSFTSAFYNYTLASGSNARSGQIMSVWSGSSIQYTDVATLDIGSTANVTLTASLSVGNVLLSTNLPSSGWTIKTVVNLI